MKISGVHLSRKVRWLSLGWCPERYTCMAEMHTISLNISQNGNPHNQCSVVDQPPNCENGAFFKVVKCFAIVTDFCSPGTSFFVLAGPCPVSLAFLNTRPQGRCENRGKRSHLRAFESQPPRPPCSQKGQLCTSSGSGRIFAEGVPQPGDMTGALCAAGRREVAADVMRAQVLLNLSCSIPDKPGLLQDGTGNQKRPMAFPGQNVREEANPRDCDTPGPMEPEHLTKFPAWRWST